jgi:catalase-peroxidase
VSENQSQTPGPPIVDDQNIKSGDAKCPFSNGAPKHTIGGTPTNASWWPNQLNLKILHQHSQLSNPMGEAFNYAE